MSIYRNITPFIDQYTGPAIINVPTDFTTIQAAIDYLTQFTLSYAVNIKVANGTYTLTAGLLFNNMGKYLTVTGNTATPASCILNLSAGQAIVVERTELIFTGFTVNGVSSAGSETGLLATEGSIVTIPPNTCTFNNLRYGISAQHSSVVTASSIAINKCPTSVIGSTGSVINITSPVIDALTVTGSVALRADSNSYINATMVSVSNVSVGSYATSGGYISLSTATFTTINTDTIRADLSGIIQLSGAITITGCVNGLVANHNSVIQSTATSLNITTSTVAALYVSHNSTIVADTVAVATCAYGISAAFASSVTVAAGTIDTCTVVGCQSDTNSVITVPAVAITNSTIGCKVVFGGSIIATGTSALMIGTPTKYVTTAANAVAVANVAGTDGSVISFT